MQALRRLRGRGNNRSSGRNSAEQKMNTIFSVGQALRRPGGDPDRLRLVRRERHPARRVNDHVRGRFLLRRRLGDVGQLSVRGHPPEFDRDAVGRGLVADIVEHDLGARRPSRTRRVGATSRSPTPASAGAAMPATSGAAPRHANAVFQVQRTIRRSPTLLRSGAVASSLVRNGYFSVNHVGLPAAIRAVIGSRP